MPAALTLKGTDAATLPTSALVVASRAERPMRYAPRVVGLHTRVVRAAPITRDRPVDAVEDEPLELIRPAAAGRSQ